MKYDAVVVGSGPNGLAAAIRLAQAKLSVLLIEGRDAIGGGMRSAELTLPHFIHDICSAIHPLALGSPFFRSLPLEQYGLKWIHPKIPLAHPFQDGTAVILDRSIEVSAQLLDEDAQAYSKLMQPFADNWDNLLNDILAPLHFPQHPLQMARLGYYGLRSAESLCQKLFNNKRTKALFAGLAAHSILPLTKPLTAAFGLILGVSGHAIGWPMPQGGSQRLANALSAYFQSLGGQIVTGTKIEHMDQIPPAKATLFDVSPKQLLNIINGAFPQSYRKRLQRYQYGPGIFKIDWALSQPIPWKAPECAQAGTIHLGGTFEEIVASEKMVWEGKINTKNFIILAQQSLFDSSRAPPEGHTAWAYCHVPNGSETDLTKQIESQIEEVAPGFRDCVSARSILNTQELELYNPNYVGGDINGGAESLSQLFSRPVLRWNPYSTPLKGVYLCSASTPPGGGVHGMCGYHAAQSVLKSIFNLN